LGKGSIVRSLPCFVVAETASSIASGFSHIQLMTFTEWSMPSVLKTGARVIASDSTLVLAPPDSDMTDIPRDTEATKAPSVVAIGTRKGPPA